MKDNFCGKAYYTGRQAEHAGSERRTSFIEYIIKRMPLENIKRVDESDMAWIWGQRFEYDPQKLEAFYNVQ